MRVVFLILALVAICTAEIIPPMQSIREAVEVRWLPPEEPFKFGEILHFNVVGKNIAQDTAICYALSAGEITGDSIHPYAIVSLPDKYVSDTLAPGDSAIYNFTLINGSDWLYDPLKDVRSYENKVGLPCFPPGEYKLSFLALWGERDSFYFEVVPIENETERVLLDTLAEAAVAYFVGRPADAILNARWLHANAPKSSLTARALILARGVAWEKEMCNDAIELDSLFWASFGGLPERWNYLPNPGFIGGSIAVLKACAEPGRIENYLDWLAGAYPDTLMTQQVGIAKERLGK